MFFKLVKNGYILGVGKGNIGQTISEAEYTDIIDAIKSAPSPAEGISYLLREDLTWESYDVPPPDPDPELDGAEVLDILMGVTE